MSEYINAIPKRMIFNPIPLIDYSKIAIVDIDDVLAEFPTVFLKYIEERTGEPLPYEEHQYGLEAAVMKNWPVPYGKGFVDDFYRSDALLDLEEIEGGLDFFNILKNLGYRTVALTGRPGGNFPEVARNTVKWLSNHGFQFDEVCFSRQKGDFVQEHYAGGKFIIGIEDHYKNAVDLARFCDVVYLRNKPHTPPVAEHPKIFPFWKFPKAIDHVIDTTIRLTDDSSVHKPSRS